MPQHYEVRYKDIVLKDTVDWSVAVSVLEKIRKEDIAVTIHRVHYTKALYELSTAELVEAWEELHELMRSDRTSFGDAERMSDEGEEVCQEYTARTGESITDRERE